MGSWTPSGTEKPCLRKSAVFSNTSQGPQGWALWGGEEEGGEEEEEAEEEEEEEEEERHA